MKKIQKTILFEAIAVIIFALIASVYFMPAFQGKRLTGEDNSANDGLKVEINKYREEHGGETPRWINSIFSGMPTYQIAPSYDSAKPLAFVEKVYHLGLPDYAWYVFVSMLGFYILLRVFDFKRWMAMLGAIVWAFSSYFFIIIAAGHLWKAITLAYIPPTIAGVALCFKKKYLWGMVVTALFAALQINGNHVQMTYYFLIPEILMFIAFIVKCIQEKELQHLFKATVAIAIAAVIAIGLNASNLYHTYKYSEDTMRGKSELVKKGKEADQTDSGLERSYITNWSYGIGETWSLLIPNIKGGASVPLAENKAVMKLADPQIASYGIYNQFGQYWGEQPGTSGPVYAGALVCMLFLLALFIVPKKNPMKWVLIASTILSILLAWGKNFMPFTDFFIDHVPLYSKFRTVASILVVAEFTIPLLAMIGLKTFIEAMTDKDKRPKMVAPLVWSTLISIAICIFYAAFPTAFGDCVSSSENESIRGQLDPTSANMIIASLSKMRAEMLSQDAWRSALIIVIGAALLFAYYNTAYKNKGEVSWKTSAAIGGLIIILCLFDMWQVNKRYMNDKNFSEVANVQTEPTPTEIDNFISQKSGGVRNYRVFDFTKNMFNDNSTAFFHNSIGGYHPAKLRRYQELIETHIVNEAPKVMDLFTPERLDTAAMVASGNLKFPVYKVDVDKADSICPVLNMLNARWFIWGNESQVFPLENTATCGNAWFIKDVKVVNNANEELDALKKYSPRHTAIIDKQFETVIGKTAALPDSADYIKLKEQTSTTANYEFVSKNGGIAVFSEIYYPGWEAKVDGKPVEIARADYVLRAIKLPAGKHQIEMTFEPQSIHTTETVAYTCLAALVLILAAAALFTWRKREDREVEVVI